MYTFAIMALAGLGVLAVANIGSRFVSIAGGVRALVLVLLGIGLAWLVNVNLFHVWGLPVRTNWLGVTITGVMIAGAAYFWYEILSFFGGLARKFTDQAETIEKTEHLRRVA